LRTRLVQRRPHHQDGRVATIVERLLFVLFSLVRTASFMVGLGLLAALLGAPAMGTGGPSWLTAILDGAIRVGLVLTITGGALQAARRWEPATTPAAVPHRGSWPAALGFSIVFLALLALVRCADLFLLWNLAAGLLDQAGFQEELARGGQGSGLLMLPILFALLVPALQTLTASFLVAVPFAFLPLLVARSPRFPKLFTMLVVTQVGFVAASLLASHTFTQVVTEAIAAMQASNEAEVLRAAEIAANLLGLVRSTAYGIVLPVVGFVLWGIFLIFAAAPRSYFAAPAAAPHPTA
jgi:hypothetical protein